MTHPQIVRTNAGWHGRIIGGNGEPEWTTEVFTSRFATVEALSRLGRMFLGGPFDTVEDRFEDRMVLSFRLDSDPLGQAVGLPVEEIDERPPPPPAVIPRPDRTPGPDVP